MKKLLSAFLTFLVLASCSGKIEEIYPDLAHLDINMADKEENVVFDLIAPKNAGGKWTRKISPRKRRMSVTSVDFA